MSEVTVRPLIREALRAHMAAAILTPQGVVRAIQALGGTPSSGPEVIKPDISKHTIRRFLSGPDGKQSQISSTSLEVIWRYLNYAGALPEILATKVSAVDPVFAALSTYYGLGAARLAFSKAEVEGCYEFFVNSEYRRGYKQKYLVRGAIRFEQDPNTNALTVTEHQAFKETPDKTEVWNGYFFIRDQTVTVVLHSKEHAPKFYVLNRLPVNASAGELAAMQGRMVKVALPSGVFTSRILLRANEKAFSNMHVFPASEAEKLIRDALDSTEGDW